MATLMRLTLLRGLPEKWHHHRLTITKRCTSINILQQIRLWICKSSIRYQAMFKRSSCTSSFVVRAVSMRIKCQPTSYNTRPPSIPQLSHITTLAHKKQNHRPSTLMKNLWLSVKVVKLQSLVLWTKTCLSTLTFKWRHLKKVVWLAWSTAFRTQDSQTRPTQTNKLFLLKMVQLPFIVVSLSHPQIVSCRNHHIKFMLLPSRSINPSSLIKWLLKMPSRAHSLPFCHLRWAKQPACQARLARLEPWLWPNWCSTTPPHSRRPHPPTSSPNIMVWLQVPFQTITHPMVSLNLLALLTYDWP